MVICFVYHLLVANFLIYYFTLWANTCEMSLSKVSNSCLEYSIPQNLQIIGYMSVDISREYHGDLSQLKYLNTRTQSKGKIHLDLNHRIHEAVKRTTDDNNEKINLLLKFLIHRIHDITIKNNFISYRRTLISIMCSAYLNEHVRIMASLFNSSIYLCSLETPQEKRRKETRNSQDEKFCAWGYKFEQYMLSDLPNSIPVIDKPVIENEEFSIYYKTALGKHNLVYGAQIDGLLATSNTVNNPPESNGFAKNLNYLKNKEFIELKTNRLLESARQEQNFKKFKMLRCWCQCYLAGLKGLLVGFRDDKGVVKRLQCYNTEDIVEYCKYEWQPEPAIRFLDLFLSYVESCLRKHPNCNKSDKVPVSLIFDVHGCDTVEVTECVDDNDYILPNWYIETILKNTQN